MSRATLQLKRNLSHGSFDIGDRVRLRMHPSWHGTVVARTLTSYIVDWDHHGPETTHAALLELTLAASETARAVTEVSG